MCFATSLHLRKKMQTPRPHMGRPFITRFYLHSSLISCHFPSTCPIYTQMKVLQTYPSLFFCDFEQAILLGDVVLFPPFCQVNCTSFKNQYKCHLLWGLLALLGRVSAFSACYLYPLCDLLFCTVIMSVPVFLPRLHAPKRRDCDALIFVCKAETGGQPIKCTINVYWVKKNPT